MIGRRAEKAIVIEMCYMWMYLSEDGTICSIFEKEFLNGSPKVYVFSRTWLDCRR